VTCYMLEYTEDWITGKSYFSQESILEMGAVFKKQKRLVA